MNLMFALKVLYNVAMKSVSRKEMVPKFHIMWSLSKITIRCPGYIPLFQYNHFAKIIISCLRFPYYNMKLVLYDYFLKIAISCLRPDAA